MVLIGFGKLLQRDLRLALRQRGDLAMVVMFFVLAVSLFPFGVGPEPKLLKRIAPGIIWVTALLAVLLSIDRIFGNDFEDGSLEQLILSPLPLELTVLTKVTAHWLTTGLPLAVVSPFLATIFHAESSVLWVLALAMALGTQSLSLIGATAAALTLGARRSSILVPLLVLPLYIPTLIFGVGAVDAALLALPFSAHLSLLGAILAISLFIAPLACAAALRQALS